LENSDVTVKKLDETPVRTLPPVRIGQNTIYKSPAPLSRRGGPGKVYIEREKSPHLIREGEMYDSY
jgi:hypothetical protein